MKISSTLQVTILSVLIPTVISLLFNFFIIPKRDTILIKKDFLIENYKQKVQAYNQFSKEIYKLTGVQSPTTEITDCLSAKLPTLKLNNLDKDLTPVAQVYGPIYSGCYNDYISKYGNPIEQLDEVSANFLLFAPKDLAQEVQHLRDLVSEYFNSQIFITKLIDYTSQLKGEDRQYEPLLSDFGYEIDQEITTVTQNLIIEMNKDLGTPPNL